MAGPGDFMASGDLRFLGVFAALSNPNVRSLRFYANTPPEGAMAWVQSESSLFHFERYSQRPDDDATVVAPANGGRWIKGVNGFRTRGRHYSANGVVLPVLNDVIVVRTVSLQSVQAGDLLLALFTCDLSEQGGAAGQAYLYFTAGGAQWQAAFQPVVASGGQASISLTTLITVAASPTDPYVVTLTGGRQAGGANLIMAGGGELNVLALA